MTLGWIGAHGGDGITGGQSVRARAVWIDLDLAFPLPAGHRRRVVADGLTVTGRVPACSSVGSAVRGASGTAWCGSRCAMVPEMSGSLSMTSRCRRPR
jgi:hypothetical protein